MTKFNNRASAAAALVHGYAFDPTHGYGLEDLLQQTSPEEPADFASFWRERYQAVAQLKPKAALRDTGRTRGIWRVYDWSYESTGNEVIKGWVLLPSRGEVKRGLLIGHGYSGRLAPDYDLEFKDAALFFPCLRGLGVSRSASISAETQRHILHNIESRRQYVLGECVEDIWIAVSAVLTELPQLAGHLGYLGISFGGGIGTLAIPWENRIQRMHLNVPTFGHHPLRLKLPSLGSAASVQKFAARKPQITDVLSYYDAATAARHIKIPVHCACALFDPAVAPAGQFAIFNALAGPKQLYILTAGHHAYPAQDVESRELQQEIYNFFADI